MISKERLVLQDMIRHASANITCICGRAYAAMGRDVDRLLNTGMDYPTLFISAPRESAESVDDIGAGSRIEVAGVWLFNMAMLLQNLNIPEGPEFFEVLDFKDEMRAVMLGYCPSYTLDGHLIHHQPIKPIGDGGLEIRPVKTSTEKSNPGIEMLTWEQPVSIEIQEEFIGADDHD